MGMRLTSPLTVLLALFAVLCLVFSSKTPYRQSGRIVHQASNAVDIGAPDERQHANYVQSLLDGDGFPVLRPGSPDLGETYQAHQPPLYYVLAAGFCKLTGTKPSDPASGGRLRLLNTIIGLGTLVALFMAARWGLKSDAIGLAAVAFAGLMPMFVALHSAVSNDPLLFLVCSWTVALAAKGIRQGWDWKLAAWCGAVVGLGLLTKTTALALLPTVAVALVCTRFWGEGKPPVRVWLLALALPVVIASPWMARNQNLYGDPFAISAFNEAFVGSPKPHTVALPMRLMTDPVYRDVASRIIDEAGEDGIQGQVLMDRVYDEVGFTPAVHLDYWVNWVGWWTGRSFIGVFGYMDVFLLEPSEPTPGKNPMGASNTLYRVVMAALALICLGWMLSLRRKMDGATKALTFTCAALLGVVALLFIRFNLQYFQGQARYLYPAIAPISLGLAVGLCFWLKDREKHAWVFVAVSLLILDFLAYKAISTGFPVRLG